MAEAGAREHRRRAGDRRAGRSGEGRPGSRPATSSSTSTASGRRRHPPARRIVGDAPVGTTVRVVVLRDGETQTLKVTLGGARTRLRPSRAEAAPRSAGPTGAGREIRARHDAQRDDRRAARRARARRRTPPAWSSPAIDETSEAWEKGLRAGDVIEEAGQTAWSRIADFEARIEATRDGGRADRSCCWCAATATRASSRCRSTSRAGNEKPPGSVPGGDYRAVPQGAARLFCAPCRSARSAQRRRPRRGSGRCRRARGR